MKILVFSPYYPPHIGGLETHAEEFNKHIAGRDIQITLFTPRLPTSAPEQEESIPFLKIIRYPATEIIANYPLPQFWHYQFWKLFFLLFREDYDVVISRTRFFLSSLLALLFTKITGTKWLHIEHGSNFVKLSSWWKSGMARLYDLTFGRLIFRFSDINISISQAVQKFVNTFDKRESPIIYRGLEFETLDRIRPDTSLQERYPDKLILCTAARLYCWKGIEYSVRAIHLLPPEIKSRIVFLILGDGEDFSRLQSLSHGAPVEMLGNLSRHQVISILKSCDIYIHSSLPGGGLSTSLLEAMYCKCATIATENEGANEVVRNMETGLLIAAKNEDELAEKIILLAEDAVLRKRLAETASQEIATRFHWQNTAQAYLKIFKKICR